MRRVALLAAAAVVAALWPVAASGDPAGGADGGVSGAAGPVSSGSHSAALAFADLEYPVPFYGRLFTNDPKDKPDAPEATATFVTSFFGEVATDTRADSLDLSFKVEGQPDPSGYQFCQTPATCADVSVRVTDEGLLYLYVPRTFHYLHLHLGDFPSLPVELSASDADTELKVYREVLVEPPTAVTGCEDYGEDNPDAYTCLFLRELLPSDAPTGVSESTLRAGLPGLVQDASNYELVFSEEFDGTPPAANDAGCRDGLSTLDDTAWVYYDACDIVDSKGEPCGNIVDGSLVMGDSGRCRSGMIGAAGSFHLATYGKLHAKYGYIEVKYTFNLGRYRNVYNNINLILFTRGTYLQFLMNRYGVEIEDWEDVLQNTDIEVDIFEYIPNSREDAAHQYANWGRHLSRDLVPTRSNKLVSYCQSKSKSIIANRNSCSDSDTFTVTRGVEWTPGGYRTFIKVDGIQDSLSLVPKDKIEVEIENPPGTRQVLTGAQKDKYFGFVDPDDTSTLLEQVAVSHMPLPIAMSVWGWLGTRHHEIRSRMKIDYIRLWQPTNHYADMEPVYQ